MLYAAMRRSHKRLDPLRWMAAVALLYVVALALGKMAAQPTLTAQALTQGWQYRWTDGSSLTPLSETWDAEGWTSLDMPAHPARPPISTRSPRAGAGTGASHMAPGDADDAYVLWLRTRLPEGGYRDPAIAIDAVVGPFEAYVGTARVHVHPAPDGLAARVPPGFPWQLVDVPEGSSGEIFALRVRSDGQAALVRGTPFYGERAEHLAWTLRRDVPRLACGFVIILIGLAGAFVVARRGDWKVPFAFGAWTVSLGAYVIFYTHVKDLLFDAPRAWFSLWLVALPTIPIAGLVFVDGMFGSGPRGWLARLLRVQLAYTAGLVFVDAICIWLYADRPRLAVDLFTIAMHGLRLLYGVVIVSGLVVVARRAREGSVEARIFLGGLTVHGTFAVNDLLAAFGVASLSWRSVTYLGSLGLTIALALILHRRYTAALARAAAFESEVLVREREKERFLRDLHDGVGGLTSNIRVLAELGQRSDERAQRSLSTIAELSSKSLAELRAFVHALDDTSTTWETLAAELRRFGAQVTSAADTEFAMTTEIATKHPLRGLLSIHILRLFQESLTNALKHRARRVTVSLSADAESAELTVQSEGDSKEGPTREGLDLGRGLANMRARADEVGGTLTIDHGPPMVVRLRVPLPMKVSLPDNPPEAATSPAVR